jgi:hypothetical protein
MEAICSSETSADFQLTTPRYIAEDKYCYNVRVLRTSISADLQADKPRREDIIKRDAKDIGVRVSTRFCRITGGSGGGLL